ncbi:MAG: prolyl oligopeptidase family serine peptidase [Saprospiraceae bacterium]
MKKLLFFTFLLFLINSNFSTAQSKKELPANSSFEPIDVFQLEYVSDPQISADGSRVLFVRNFKDIMTDRNRSNIWMSNLDGSEMYPITTGAQSDFSPRLSPTENKLLYISNKDGQPQMYLRWLTNDAESKLTNLTYSPSNLSWSPDGKWIAFLMSVPFETKPLVNLPAKPEGANWETPPKYIDQMKFKADGAGFLRNVRKQLFVLSVDGGTPRQLTFGDYEVNGTPEWSSGGTSILFTSNRNQDREMDPRNSEIYEVNINSGEVSALTKRHGPDSNPKVSPDGKTIAYLGNDENYDGYQVTHLYVMTRNGQSPKCVTCKFDRDVENINWSKDGLGIYFQYNNEGNTKIAISDLNGKITDLAKDVGGLSIGRPYSGGQYSVSKNGKFAFTHSTPDHPADLATGDSKSKKINRLTRLNDDLFSHKKLGEVEEIWYESSFDKRKIQGWICKPPNFDPSKKYPFILEIHGGPFANYGDRFSAEIQLFAAAGYVVLYTNPRGSTSYGKEFGNLIHHNYPSQDYDDLMSGVDAVIKKGYIDEDNLMVTGGSGGGVLTSWIVGKTNRFRAAVVAKPVINWYSFVLYADGPAFFYKYWFPGKPWDHMEHYMKRSPISLVGNVKTPTMLLTGEQDYRTPMGESEQYYAALKLNNVETALVRIQGSGHGIAAKPSNLMAKVVYILGWFERYKK